MGDVKAGGSSRGRADLYNAYSKTMLSTASTWTRRRLSSFCGVKRERVGIPPAD